MLQVRNRSRNGNSQEVISCAAGRGQLGSPSNRFTSRTRRTI